ncbi:MAG: hypothetical protein QXL94_04445 [Candidatus Parvarchaeum sp.]
MSNRQYATRLLIAECRKTGLIRYSQPDRAFICKDHGLVTGDHLIIHLRAKHPALYAKWTGKNVR